jgi:DNA-binding response OmpR family regulator
VNFADFIRYSSSFNSRLTEVAHFLIYARVVAVDRGEVGVSGEPLARQSARAEAQSEFAKPAVVLRGNEELARVVEPTLLGAGYSVERLPNSPPDLERLRERRPIAFLLEFGVHRADVAAVCRTLRSQPAFSKVAIILLAAEANEPDRVFGLEAGADAYLAMPFAARELIALIKAILRSYARRSEGERLAVGDIEIDVPAMAAKVRGEPVPLSITEFRLLEFLCRNSGRAISRDQLVQVISKNAHVRKRAVDVYVRRLRQKIEVEPAQPAYLKTVRAVGYRMDSGRQLSAPTRIHQKFISP